MIIPYAYIYKAHSCRKEFMDILHIVPPQKKYLLDFLEYSHE